MKRKAIRDQADGNISIALPTLTQDMTHSKCPWCTRILYRAFIVMFRNLDTDSKWSRHGMTLSSTRWRLKKNSKPRGHDDGMLVINLGSHWGSSGTLNRQPSSLKRNQASGTAVIS